MALTLVITGASGLVGRHLQRIATAAGHDVRPLSRRKRDGYSVWNPRAAAASDPEAIEALRAVMDGADAVINLAGSSVANGRLGKAHLKEIRSSRLMAADALAAAWRQCERPPPAWIQASAVGYYGDCGDELVPVERAPGTNLLAPICVAWEAAGSIDPNGPRRCICRIGVVVAADADAWKKTITPIKLGVGGPLGSGRQFWPWIHVADLARAFLFLAERDDLEGPFNLTAPEPVRQVDFTKAIARRLGRPAWLRTPAAALRLALGPLADNLVLPSCRATPDRLLRAGFEFETPDLTAALDQMLGTST